MKTTLKSLKTSGEKLIWWLDALMLLVILMVMCARNAFVGKQPSSSPAFTPEPMVQWPSAA